MKEKLANLAVWTKTKSVKRKISERTALEIRELLSCFNSAEGASTFPTRIAGGKIFTVVEVQPES